MHVKVLVKTRAYFRSIELEELKEILLFHNIEFYNIQYSNETNEINNLKKKYNIIIKEIPNIDIYNDLYGLASFIDTCDLVITIGNTNAHIAAAIGKPTHLLLPKGRGNYWYWENECNSKNLWYSSIIKYQQTKIDDWKDPINQLSIKLKNLNNSI